MYLPFYHLLYGAYFHISKTYINANFSFKFEAEIILNVSLNHKIHLKIKISKISRHEYSSIKIKHILSTIMSNVQMRRTNINRVYN